MDDVLSFNGLEWYTEISWHQTRAEYVMSGCNMSMKGCSLVLIMLAIGGVLVGACALPSKGAETTQDRTITVIGTGEATITPDLAHFQAGVEVRADTVKEAANRNNEIMEAIVTALINLGVEEKDIQTSYFSISQELEFDRFPSQEGVQGGEEQIRYRVSNMVQVTVRDIEKASELVDATVEARANNIWGVSLTISDTKALESDARAEEIATLADLQLGQVLSVSENITSSPIQEMGIPSLVGMGGGGGAPISPGEASVYMQVQVTYAAK